MKKILSLKIHKILVLSLSLSLVFPNFVFAGKIPQDNIPLNSTSDNKIEETDTYVASDNSSHIEMDNYGFIPMDISDFDFYHNEKYKLFRALRYDEYYVSNSVSKKTDGVTPVLPSELLPGDQGGAGICWIYSTNKAMEFNIYKKNGPYTNLSEKNTAYYFWNKSGTGSEGNALNDCYTELKDRGTSTVHPERKAYYIGGNANMIDGYLAAWRGTVPEKGDDAFNDTLFNKEALFGGSGEMSIPDKNTVYSKDAGHVLNTVMIPVSSPINDIKDLILEYGAVTIPVGSRGASKSNPYPAWYTSAQSTDHQVTIIGWDDNYPKENFPNECPSDGAWYVLNSWGTDPIRGVDDDNGGFWLSYSNGSFNNSSNVVTAYDMTFPGRDDMYDHNYIGGYGGGFGEFYYRSNNNPRAGVSYMINGLNNTTGYEKVNAIGFKNVTKNISWYVRVYKGKNAVDGILMEEKSFYGFDVGYHTIKLNKPFVVKKGDYIYVEIEPQVKNIQCSIPYADIVNPQGNMVVPRFEVGGFIGDYDGITHFAKTAYGTTYINDEKRTDMQILLHAYTSDFDPGEGFNTMDIAVTYAELPDEEGKTVNVNDYVNIPDNCTISSVTSDNSKVAKINNDFSIMTGNAGKATVTVKLNDGRTDTLKVTVSPKAIKDNWFSISESLYTSYDSSPVCPKVNFERKDIVLTEGKDYTVEYKDNTKTGTAKAIITGKGNYKGSVSINYSIIVVVSSSFDYNKDSIPIKAGSTIYINDYFTFTPGSDSYGNIYYYYLEKYTDDSGVISEIYPDSMIIDTKKNMNGIITVKITSDDGKSIVLTFDVKKDNESDTPDNPDNPVKPDDKPDDNPDDKTKEEKNEENEIIKENTDIKTVSTSSGEYKVTVSMNNKIPYTKSKKGVVSNLKYSIVITGKDGKPCGISVKKIKATKPKKGISKVTFKLKGSTKEERKAVKALNKGLRKMEVRVGE